jgi:FG-GAP-like repeat
MVQMYRLIAFAAIVFLLLQGCSETKAPDQIYASGRKLAMKYCTSCHQFADPGLLDKNTWYYSVMPEMSAMLGIRHVEGSGYTSDPASAGAITVAQWDTILAYYIHIAPDSLQLSARTAQPINVPLEQFRIAPVSFGLTKAATTSVKITKDNILVGDGFTKELFAISPTGKLIRKDTIGVCIANVHDDNDAQWVLTAGVMHPSDAKQGRLVRRLKNEKEPKLIFDSLQRPVYAEYEDINKDGRTDIVLCEYGNFAGRLSWFEQKTDGTYFKHILREIPGAIRTAVRDLNGDGRLDVVALMAQGDEGMFVYYQQPDGSFRENKILKFPPVFGVNYFELRDFNGDGYADILITDGDNGDYSPILKPYHGIRIYLNDGRNNFSQKLFLPVNGACKAMAEDFDKDGDTDMVSIAFFADFAHRPLESFVYWENLGGMKFKAWSGNDALSGHWLTMDVGDVNSDGMPDIVLGSANIELGAPPPGFKKRWDETKLSALILYNKMKNK